MLRWLVFLVVYLVSTGAGAAVTLKIATITPDGTSWMQSMRKGAKEVSERTDGRVKLRFYPGGVMGNDKSVLRKIRIGQLHGGAITSGGLESIYPDLRLYSLPLLFRSFDEVDYVRSRMDRKLIEGLEKKGYVSFGLSEGGFAYLMCTAPLETLADLKEQKVWTPEGDEVTRITLEALGVSPIPLPLTDVLTGLQTGLVNTITSSPIATIALQWHTQVKYLTELPILYFSGTLVVSKKALSKVSEQDRAILEAVMERTFIDISKQNRKDNTKALAALKKQGISFIQPSNDGQAQWRKQVSHAIETMSQEGFFSRDLYDELQQHLARYRQETSGK